MKNENPVSRLKNIIVQELPDELLICDTSNNRMFCLNKTAAEVWELADGTRNVKEISRLLSKELRSNVGEELVAFALQELSKESLLVEKMPVISAFQNLSRREVIRRVGFASMIELPLVSSLTMPTAARAMSAAVPCQDDSECNGGCCNLSGVCVPAGDNGCFCFDDSKCSSNCCDNGNNVCADASNCSCIVNPGRPGCPCTDGAQCDVGCCTGDANNAGVCAGGC